MSSTTPKKGDIIINPKTQRPVKVGSRTWLKLVKDGLVEGRYSDPNELYEVKSSDKITVENKIEELNKTLPRGQQAVRGRGKYTNKIVRRQKRPNPQELTQYTAKTAARTIAQNVDKLDTYEDLETQLEKMILEEMMKGEPRQVKPRGLPPARKQAPPQEKFYEHQTAEYDEDDEYANSEDNEYYE
jgi:hypothetical protein